MAVKQLLPDKFSSRIPRDHKLNNFSGFMIENKIIIEPLVQNRIYREKIHRTD